MARRPGGKAASRRSRQRRAQRPLPPRLGACDPIRRGGSARGTRGGVWRGAAEGVGSGASAPSAARAYAGGGSSLTARERAEYHYVERDLRNIGILTVLMIALLIVAWFVFNALGIIG